MIERLQNSDKLVAEQMHTVFLSSYSIEAKLLNATDFPPLRRTIENYINSPTAFFGYLKEGELAGIIEIEHTPNFTDINSLVVSPEFFKQGIASALIQYALDTFSSPIFTVETGLENKPAIALYKKFGFKVVKQWDTSFGIEKIKFELVVND